MKKFTFFIEEYDSRASITKYYKTFSYGNDWKYAFSKVKLPNREDYSYKILTLNQFNSLKNRPNLCAIIWEVFMALYPFKIRIKQ